MWIKTARTHFQIRFDPVFNSILYKDKIFNVQTHKLYCFLWLYTHCEVSDKVGLKIFLFSLSFNRFLCRMTENNPFIISQSFICLVLSFQKSKTKRYSIYYNKWQREVSNVLRFCSKKWLKWSSDCQNNYRLIFSQPSDCCSFVLGCLSHMFLRCYTTGEFPFF